MAKVITVGPTSTWGLGDTGGDDIVDVADAIDYITIAALRLQHPDCVVRFGNQTHVPADMDSNVVRDVRNTVYLGWCESDWLLESDETPEEIAARLYAGA
jgi:hypothetical protein